MFLETEQLPHDFIVLYDGPREVLRVKHPDGEVIFGDGATQDEAARLFWKHLGGFIAAQVAQLKEPEPSRSR
jgi:hypothetical protein